ncbi:hypothetical protein BH23GEM6_BH23GEM6_24600 [soil metagenome]
MGNMLLVWIAGLLLTVSAASCVRSTSSAAGSALPSATRCAGLQRVHVSNPLRGPVDVFARVADGRLQIVGSIDAGSSSSFVLPQQSSGTPVIRWSGPAGEQSRALSAVRVRVSCS